MSWHQVQLTPSTAYAEYSIHRVQHLPKIVCIPFIFMIFSWPLNVAAASGMPPYTINHHQISSPWDLKCKVTLPQSHSCELTNWWTETQHPACRPLTASKHSFPNSGDYGLQIRTILPSKWISKLAPSRAPNSLDDVPKCISTLPPFRPPSSFPNSVNRSLHVRTIMALKCTFANSLDHSLQDHLYTRSITPSKCIFKLVSFQAPRLHDHCVNVNHLSGWITALESIAEFTQSSFSCAHRIPLKHRRQLVQI